MKKSEIDDLFKSGEIITVSFYTKMNYTIGKKNLTEKQFTDVVARFNGQYVVDKDFGGWTKHYYTFTGPISYQAK